MIDQASLKQFLSGRLLGLIILLGVQLAVVRWLPPTEYGRYALAIALAALLQTLTSFGLPRVAAKFLSGAGELMTCRTAGRLALSLVGVRVLACLLVLIPVLWISGVLAPRGGAQAAMLWSGAAYALASTLQADADAAAQALRLQIASRRAAIGEPLLRLASIPALALGGAGQSAAAVLWISAATAAIATVILTGAVWTALATGKDAPAACNVIDWREIRPVAIGGYGGTLSWLAFSPAVIRLLASRVLPVDAFAGFSFVQALVVSAQRYAPSFTLFPLIEPAVMADVARTGRPHRLGAALSLLVKLDAAVVGGMIVGASAAGAPAILLLTNGRYGGAAVFLPLLLAAIVANASHRSYEIAAIALGAAGTLIRSLGFTLAWLAVAIATKARFGVWPLLLCPMADALTRFWVVQRALSRQGAPRLFDLKGLGHIVLAAGLMSLVAMTSSTWAHPNLIVGLAIGSVAGAAYLAIVVMARPIASGEAEMLPTAPWFLKRLVTGSHGVSKPLRVIVLTPRGLGGV